MKNLAVFGASGHGKVVAEIAELTGWDSVDFFDDAWPAKRCNGNWNVIGNYADLLNLRNNYEGVIVAIGNNKIRLNKAKHLLKHDCLLPTLVHPSSTVSCYAEIGCGSVIMAGAIINPYVSVGVASIVNTAATIDHDCILGDAVHISPGANLAGDVRIGDMAWVGIGSSIKHGIQIGSAVVVGAGAVVVKNVGNGVTVIGVPANRQE